MTARRRGSAGERAFLGAVAVHQHVEQRGAIAAFPGAFVEEEHHRVHQRLAIPPAIIHEPVNR